MWHVCGELYLIVLEAKFIIISGFNCFIIILFDNEFDYWMNCFFRQNFFTFLIFGQPNIAFSFGFVEDLFDRDDMLGNEFLSRMLDFNLHIFQNSRLEFILNFILRNEVVIK